MARVCKIQRELRIKQLVAKHEKQRTEYRKIINDPNASLDEKLVAQAKMQKLPRNSSKVRMRNRCAETGRSRGVYRRFGVSRNVLRELAMFGYVPGLTKASW